MKTSYLFMICCAAPFFSTAQLQLQKGGGLYLQDHALITMQGDLVMEESIEGEGTLLFNGRSEQKIDADGNTLPSVVVENKNGVSLLSGFKINRQVVLQSGNMILGANSIELNADATVSGSVSGYFITGERGKIVKSVRQNLGGFLLPVGTNTEYVPLILQSSGKYQHARVEIGAYSKVNPNKPLSSRDYLNNYWTVGRKGIEGELTATAFYNGITGEHKNIRPCFWDGSKWNYIKSSVDTEQKFLHIDVPEGSGEIYAMREGNRLQEPHTSITLLPNPVKNTATLVIRNIDDEHTTIIVADMNGKTILTQSVLLRKGVNQVKIDATSLAKGQYVISSSRINTGVVKMIKE